MVPLRRVPGHNFLVVKPLIPTSSSVIGAMMIDSTDWAV